MSGMVARVRRRAHRAGNIACTARVAEPSPVNAVRTHGGRLTAWACAAALGIAASCGAATTHGATTNPAGAGPTTTGPVAPVGPTTPTSLAPLVAPQTSTVQDAQFFAEVAKADSTLSTYIQTYGNVAFRTLLTDGSAFCAFLARGGGVDTAMMSVAIGARGVGAQTHLPSSVTTFNTIDAVALLTLCPAEQGLVPGAVQTRIRALGRQLGQGTP